MIYAYFVIHIKRLHDLNHSGWWSLLLLLPIPLGLTIYLAIRKGSLESNRFGESPLTKKPSQSTSRNDSFIKDPYERLMAESKGRTLTEESSPAQTKPFNLFSLQNGLIGCGILFALFAFSKLRKGADETTGLGQVQEIAQAGGGARSGQVQEIENLIKKLPFKSLREKMLNNKRGLGGIYMNGKLVDLGTFITEDRVLIRRIDVSRAIKQALSKRQKVELLLLDGTLLQIISHVASNPSPLVQMAVFQVDQAVGTPGPETLNDKNRQTLEKMGAFR